MKLACGLSRLWLLLLLSQRAAGFLVVQRPTISFRASISSRFVFERMSEDCISAIMTAQEQTARLELAQLELPCLLAGVVNHPETVALQRTLRQYKITWRRVETTLNSIYVGLDRDKGWLAGFRAAADQEDRPFSSSTKQTLNRAGQLADQMGSASVCSQHVFLALLDYKEEQGGAESATDDNKAWALLQKLDVLNDDDTALQICQTLLEKLKETSASSVSQELVTGSGSGSSKMPTLEDVGQDLTEEAKLGLLDPVYGRDREIRACVRTLIRRRKNNVVLIGDAGVGKTAIAEGVAQILADEENCPVPLTGHRLVSVELANLVAGTKYRGEFEERLQSLISEVTDPKAPPTIIFLDEIHNLVGAGSAEGGMDAANLLKPALARGQLQVIGATTIAEYRQYIEKDAALERRLQPVFVKEPSVPQTVEILEAVAENYEKHHSVKFTKDALRAAAVMSERYINDRFLPDKALDLIDEAGATAQLDFHESGADSKPTVTEETIAGVISEWSGIPLGKLETKEMDRLMALEDDMGRRVKGQGRALRGVARAIRRARSGLRDPKRPVASFLFCGPTGTGKTELCKTLAETYYGAEKDLVRIDCSEYMEKHTVSRLTGPPPGYVGYEAGGQLTEAIRRAPHSVLLLDEIEKAHEDVLNILLQIMEDGILTDGKGRTVNFKNVVLVMTSNVGSRRILDLCRKGSMGNSVAGTIESIQSVNGSYSPAVNPDEAKPLEPQEVLKRMQSNPQAASLMMKAASDPEIMGAMRTAMNGSPNDLRIAAQKSPVVSKFLQDMWGILADEEELGASIETANVPSSGLDAIRSSFQDTISQWGDKATETFASELMGQMDTESANNKGEHELYPQLIEIVKEELEETMKPELLNRIDEIVVFSPLTAADLSKIAKRNIDLIIKRATEEHTMELEVEDDLVYRVMHEGSANADTFGARPLRRAAQRYVEDSLSDVIIQGFLKPGSKATLSLASPGPNGKDRVRVASHGKTVEVEVEDASGGVGSAIPKPQSADPVGTNGSLRTEPV